jgi:hypothetical protein
MPVPNTVDSIRQQIVDAVKLSLDTVGTILSINANYGQYNDSTKYPLFKVWMQNSSQESLRIRSIAIRADELKIAMVPWCKEDDFELSTSKIIESASSLLNAQTIKSYMYSSYQSQFEDLIFQSAELANTDLPKPYAYVVLTYTAKYRIGA